MLTIYALTWLSIIVAQISPGPNLTAVVSVGVAQGRKRAILVALGIAFGTLVWALGAALGLGALLKTEPRILTALKLLGGLYLLFLGLGAVRAALRNTAHPTIAAEAGTASDVAAFRRGLLVVLSNPESALMWASVDSFLFAHGLSAAHVLIIGPLSVLSSAVIYGAYGYLFSTGVAMQGYARYARWFEAVFALVFCAIGISFVWSAVGDF